MTDFEIGSSTLVDLVETAERRTFAEEIDTLTERGPNLHWLLEALQSN